MEERMVQQWGDYEIRFDEAAMDFVVNTDGGKRFPSYKEATEYIDRRMAADERNKREKLDVAVITSEGKEHKLTGVHATNGYALLTPKRDRYQNSQIYLDHPTVRVLLKRQAELQARFRAIEEELRKTEISIPWTVKGYDKQMEWLKRRLAECREAALELKVTE